MKQQDCKINGIYFILTGTLITSFRGVMVDQYHHGKSIGDELLNADTVLPNELKNGD